MPVYKIIYTKECENIREIHASSEKEALKKFYDCDCIKDYEYQCIGEEVISVTKDS
ncbi:MULTISPECIES: hypothetical protein [Gracilibacillus]|uniref:hypothetical protein n=1 Tax=Gracilibacillus TaxID=74385 RepID=UPI000A5EC575|nr:MULTISPECIES: hypothetical protein [Gracilibacillus]